MHTTFTRRLQTFVLALAGLVPVSAPASPALAAEQGASVRVIDVIVEGSYAPSRITVRKGERVQLRFLRKEWNGCTREVLIPALKIRKDLPTNKAVLVDLPTAEAGEYEFRCGMNMVRGTIVVSAG
jgi:plastocyanin domain-containing protein